MKTNNLLKISISVFVFVFAFVNVNVVNAQTVTFDADDYSSVSVYDPWELSPFRTGALTGNAAVVSNPLTDVNAVLGYAPNGTANVVGFQRSHYGSNTYGVRINLKQPFRLTKTNQYLHVMTLCPDKPSASRMMVIGLGKRVESAWSWQTGEDEQFWSLTENDVAASDNWQDLVFSFKGFSYSTTENANFGIDIYALVLIPDVATRHDGSDFIVYFDQLEVNTSSDLRFSIEPYPISFDKSASPANSGRVLSAVGLTVNGTTTTASTSTSKAYNDLTQSNVFAAKPGQSVTPTFSYNYSSADGYVYVDWESDGAFSSEIGSDMKPVSGTNLAAYRAYKSGSYYYASDGTYQTRSSRRITYGIPAFTVPSTTDYGFYRMRYKVDNNNLDAEGSSSIVSSYGAIADVLLDVHSDYVTVNDQQLNGRIVLDDQDSTSLKNYQAAYGQDLTIRMVPAPGFTYSGIRVRYGYDLAMSQFDAAGNPRWFERTYSYSQFTSRCLTLPAEIIIGNNVLIEGYFVEGEERIPVEGSQITALSQLKNDMAYYIYNKYDCGYLVWNNDASPSNLSIKGATENATTYTHGWPSDANYKAWYQEAIDPFDETECWQILKKNNSYYLYQPANHMFVTREGEIYKFTSTETALDALQQNSGGTFSIHAGGGYSTSSTSFAVLATCNTDNVVCTWTWNDNGGEYYIVENPNVDVYDIFATVLPGDVDQDTKVSIADVPNLVSVLRGRKNKLKEADADENGIIEKQDVDVVVYKILEMIE